MEFELQVRWKRNCCPSPENIPLLLLLSLSFMGWSRQGKTAHLLQKSQLSLSLSLSLPIPLFLFFPPSPSLYWFGLGSSPSLLLLLFSFSLPALLLYINLSHDMVWCKGKDPLFFLLSFSLSSSSFLSLTVTSFPALSLSLSFS